MASERPLWIDVSPERRQNRRTGFAHSPRRSSCFRVRQQYFFSGWRICIGHAFAAAWADAQENAVTASSTT